MFLQSNFSWLWNSQSLDEFNNLAMTVRKRKHHKIRSKPSRRQVHQNLAVSEEEDDAEYIIHKLDRRKAGYVRRSNHMGICFHSCL